MSIYTTEWTGSYPNLCIGEWKLYKDGDELFWVEIPFQHKNAETENKYSQWCFDKDWYEQDEYYTDGLTADEWIEKYRDWLSFFAPEEDWRDIYRAFKVNDWRSGSCGGCI